jgi:hypothetical protein
MDDVSPRWYESESHDEDDEANGHRSGRNEGC